MTPLRKRMIQEMELRNFAPKTIELYVDNVAKFAKHFGKSPELLGEEHVREYLVYLVEERKLAVHGAWTLRPDASASTS